jgi:tetratricopeptide (TPR) repeat protein
MREDVRLYDRLDLIFKYPPLDKQKFQIVRNWEDYRRIIEGRIIEEKGSQNVFYAIYNPWAVKLPDKYQLLPYGIVNRVTKQEVTGKKYEMGSVWRYYATESFYDTFSRDFMNREVSGYYFFHLGEFFFMTGQDDLGLRSIETASRIGFDNPFIHTVMAIFLTNRGVFNKAREELEKSLIYDGDPGYVHYVWGYLYAKMGDYEQAIGAFKKAIELKPSKFAYYNNLAFSLYEAGKKDEAFLAFQESLAINGDQPEIREFIREHGLNYINDD